MACRVDRSRETGDLVVCDCGYAGGPFTNAGEARDAARRHRQAHPKPRTPRQPDKGD